MSVSAYPKDSDGAALSTKVTALSTQASALGNGPAKFAAQVALDQAQRELVDHYMAKGRLTAANILSTMT
jgi:hypothetical protein